MTLSKSNGSSEQSNLNSQLAKLGQKLISYRIVDRQGIFRATVADIYYDADNELNLLIELGKIENKLSLRRLEPQDICQLDLANKLILSNLSNQQLESLPLYQPVPSPLKDALIKSPLYDDCEMNPTYNNNQESNASEVYHIPLLEEKLRVDCRHQKIGEVIVRKQVETKIIKVPVRREKLVVERIGKNPKLLTEVVIGEVKVNGFKYEELNNDDNLHITRSHFLDLQTAEELLEAVASLSSAANARVRLEIVTNCSEHQIQHQDICDRYQ